MNEVPKVGAVPLIFGFKKGYIPHSRIDPKPVAKHRAYLKSMMVRFCNFK